MSSSRAPGEVWRWFAVPAPASGPIVSSSSPSSVEGEVGQRDLGEHSVLVEVHVTFDEREQCLVHAAGLASQHVGRVRVDGTALVDVVRVRRAPLGPRQLVAVQARVEWIGVLELTLQGQVRLAGEVPDALGATPRVGGEVVVAEPLRQRVERRGPTRPSLTRGVGHRGYLSPQRPGWPRVRRGRPRTARRSSGLRPPGRGA